MLYNTKSEFSVINDTKMIEVQNLLKNRKLAKAISDSAFGNFLSLIKSKAAALGVPVIEASQFYASSKTCSSCGHIKKDLTLADRAYHCDVCQYHIDRDVNAAINLKHLALGYRESLNACGV